MQLQDVPALRSYLTTRLTALSDADPAALADYIIALLKHEKPPAELKSFCAGQLVDFLHGNTEQFVESLFRRIEGGEQEQEEEEGVNVTTASAPIQVPPSVMARKEDDRRMRDNSYSDEEERGRGDRHGNYTRRRSRSPSSSHREDRRYPSRRDYEFRDSRGRMPMPPFMPPPMPLPHFRGPRTSRYSRDRVQNAPLEGRSATRLVIDKIPQDSCSISTVNEYFSRFGTIVNITVQPELQRARLEYATHEQANSAYTSPEVIFGNRFVKVYWDSEDLSTPNVRQASSTFTFARPIAPVIPPRVEALQKKQEALRGMLELQKQKQELLTKYIAEQKELLEKLENKTLSDIERQGITKTLQGIEELIKSLNPPPVKKVSGEESSGKLAEINPSQTTGPILRGGPMTRGRGGGRGGIVNAFTSRSAHRLDLRPTAFLMSPIPSRVGREINSIKKLFEPYGEIKNITLAEDGSGAIISFVRRADAEKALFYMPKTDLGEPFTLDWVAPATPSPALSNASAPVEMNPTDVMGGEGEDEDDIPEHIAFEEEAHWKR